MRNNTKVRLHLTKQLFESLAKQVLSEAKGNMSGGAYTEAVKVPKAKKSSDIKATDKMKKMDEMEFNVAEKDGMEAPTKVQPSGGTPDKAKLGPKSVSDLRIMMIDIAKELPKMKDVQAAEIQAVGELLKSVMDKIGGGNVSAALGRADKAFDVATQNIDSTPMSEMSSKEKMAKGLYKEDDTMDFQSGAFDVSEEESLGEITPGYIGLSPDQKEALEWLAGAVVSGAGGTILANYAKDIKNLANLAMSAMKGKGKAGKTEPTDR